MSVAVGNVAYAHGQNGAQCSGVGIIWTSEDVDNAIKERVTSVLFDYAGRAEVHKILAVLAETEFAHEGLSRVLNDGPADVESWRVGEAIAETYLADHRECLFPWPDSRDERKRGSNLPGADLVGLRADESGYCFAFGEVKTSSDNNYPPGVMYGPMGMKQQLEGLRDDVYIRDGLMKYLLLRAIATDWLPKFQIAAKRYLNSDSDIQLYGVLIRDVQPHSDDLRTRVEKLEENCPGDTRIELLAIYLPSGTIDKLPEKALSELARGDA